VYPVEQDVLPKVVSYKKNMRLPLARIFHTGEILKILLAVEQPQWRITASEIFCNA